MYYPILGEVDILPIIEIFKKDKKIVFPKIQDDKNLSLFFVKDLKDLEKSKFNIYEPKKNLKKAYIYDVDIILVPGIAFDKKGYRLGFGKGYYDRLLKKANCYKIGIAYEFQIITDINHKNHDIPMNMVITEKNIWKF